MKTTRFQIKRTKGWRKPAGGIYCTRPGKWGNPFFVPPLVSTEECFLDELRGRAVRLHRDWLMIFPAGRKIALAAKNELRGKKLGCWCPLGKPCHVDNLIDAAEGRI